MKYGVGHYVSSSSGSHPARGAWVEIVIQPDTRPIYRVAPRKGCVG